MAVVFVSMTVDGEHIGWRLAAEQQRELQGRIDTIRNDRQHPANNEGHPRHAAGRAELQDLYTQLYPPAGSPAPDSSGSRLAHKVAAAYLGVHSPEPTQPDAGDRAGELATTERIEPPLLSEATAAVSRLLHERRPSRALTRPPRVLKAKRGSRREPPLTHESGDRRPAARRAAVHPVPRPLDYAMTVCYGGARGWRYCNNPSRSDSVATPSPPQSGRSDGDQRGAAEQESAGLWRRRMEPSDSTEPKLKVVAHKGIVGVSDLSGQDAEDDIQIRTGIMNRAPDIKPESRSRRQVRVANGLPKRIPRYVQIRGQGHHAPCVEHHVERDGGTWRELSGMRRNAVHGIAGHRNHVARVKQTRVRRILELSLNRPEVANDEEVERLRSDDGINSSARSGTGDQYEIEL